MLAFLKEFKKRCFQDGVFDLSAQLAYYILLSFFPFLLLSVTLLAYLPFRSQDILLLIQPFTPTEAFQLIKVNLSHILDIPRGDLLSISAISTIYLASLAFRSVIRIMNDAYHTQQKRPLWKNLILGVVLMCGLFLVLLISLLFPVFGKLLGQWMMYLFGANGWYSILWGGMRWVLSSLVLSLFFLFMYKVIPQKKLTFEEVLPGVVFSTFGWQLSSLVFSSYVNSEHYSLIYGNLGGVIMMVGWFYLTAVIFVLGVQINAILRNLYRERP